MNTKELTQHECWKLANQIEALRPKSRFSHNKELSDLIKKGKQNTELSEETKRKLLTHPSPLLKLFKR